MNTIASKFAQLNAYTQPSGREHESKPIVTRTIHKMSTINASPIRIIKNVSTGAAYKGLGSRGNSCFLQLTKTWDTGSRSTRELILREFIASNADSTAPELDRDLNNGGSLFLIRISAWLRLTFLLGYDLVLQLKSIRIFVGAISGSRFLEEFLEIGGVLTVLDILTAQQAREVDKSEALLLLICIAQNGKVYKEFICESYGVRQITECLSKTISAVTMDYCRNLMVKLGKVHFILIKGNPKFAGQIFKGLTLIVTSTSSTIQPTALQIGIQGLRLMLSNSDSSIISPSTTLLEPICAHLKSEHMYVQYEAYQLLNELMKHKGLSDHLMTHLILIMRNVVEVPNHDIRNQSENKSLDNLHWEPSSVDQTSVGEKIMFMYAQQTYATKLIGIFIAESDAIAYKIIYAQVCSALLNVIANTNAPDSQNYAAATLNYLAKTYKGVYTAIKKTMGSTFLDLVLKKPDTFYLDLTREQCNFLRANSLKIVDKSSTAVNSSVDSDSEGAAAVAELIIVKNEIVETTQKQEIIEAYENDNRIQMQKQMDAEHIQEAMFISTHQPGITTAFAGNSYGKAEKDIAKPGQELANFRALSGSAGHIKTNTMLGSEDAKMRVFCNDGSIFSKSLLLDTSSFTEADLNNGNSLAASKKVNAWSDDTEDGSGKKYVIQKRSEDHAEESVKAQAPDTSVTPEHILADAEEVLPTIRRASVQLYRRNSLMK